MLVRSLTLAACLLATQVRAEDLTIGMAGAVTSMDPHFHNASPNNSLAMQIFDRLVERGPDGQLRPGLAESWAPIGETAWEFKLRSGVTWHDGKPLTGDDVAFSLTRARSVPNSPGGFGGFLRNIGAVTEISPLLLRIETKAPSPGLPGDLANVAIVSRHVGEGATTADYNSGKAAIGTGAYRLLRFNPGERVELARNPGWWNGSPAWEKATYRMMPNAASRTAALLSRDVDMIEMPGAADLPRLRQTAGVRVVSGAGLRVIYLAPSSKPQLPNPAFATAADGSPLPANPLAKREVRQALSVAINRQALVERVMEGTATATAQILPAGTFSYDATLRVPAPAPDEARALLKQAGFPDGFRLTLHVPSDRYPNAPAIGQAIAQMWTRIGVRTTLVSLPWSAYSAQNGSFAISLVGLGNATFDATSMLVNVLGTRDPSRGTGASNDMGYSNPALDALTARAASTFDPPAREALLIEATRQAMGDGAIIPLYHQSNTWALREGLDYTPRVDERTLAKDVRAARP
ncbi:ABC transporter substrate-binding protein [Acetobacteraceae bacterium H6797]|nr:ABC transporter substrate-binding protein [Acetobacteraceae bacterium H6797]